jgi:RNA polymerase sigma-70 factor (ECF subfamily)
MTDDRPLVESAIRGELYAFNQLMKSWHKRIFNFAYRYLNDYDELRRSRSRPSSRRTRPFGRSRTRGGSGRGSTSLPATAAGPTPAGPAGTPPSRCTPGTAESSAGDNCRDGENPEKQLLSRDWERLLKQAMALIPEEQRLVIIMKEYEGLTFHEIAEVLSEPENTVKSRMYYGLKALRKVLTKWNITKEAIQYEE